MRIAVICMVVMILSGSGIAGAQEQKNELVVTAGVGSFQDIAQSIGNIGVVIATFGFISYDTKMVTPVIGVHYKRHINKWVSVGGTFNYQQFEDTYYILGEEVGSTDINYYTYMGRFDLTYLHRPIFQMYSGLSAGVAVLSESGTGVESDNAYGFAFQLNALGLRLGKQFAAVLELGLGFNGLIAGGVSYTF